MRKTFRLILAAALCGLAFISCTQDINVDDPVLSSAKGTRIINASFASATKTILDEDGLTPYFENGDQIAVSNSEESEICTVTVSGDNAWFSTNLEGELEALYPASVGLFNEGGVLIGHMIPDNQSGFFKDANITEATISFGSTTAIFENHTALFKVIPPEGTKKFRVGSNYRDNTDIGFFDFEVGNGTDALDAYYVAIPPFELNGLFFDTGTMTKNVPGIEKALAGTMYTIDEKGWVTNDALPGLFTVNAEGKQVYFSKGNLQAEYYYDEGKYTWMFATKQYEYIGNDYGNTSIDDQYTTAVVDLFGWSTASTNYGISTSEDKSDYSGDFVDWGKNIGNGSIWRTLTTEEWQYLLGSSAKRDGKYKCGVTVCRRENCLIIAPDDFTETIADSYDATAWSAAEAAGLVCLPAVGYRYGSGVDYVGEYGYYWSSSAFVDNIAYVLGFYGDSFNPASNGDRRCGNSVRLVTDAE